MDQVLANDTEKQVKYAEAQQERVHELATKQLALAAKKLTLQEKQAESDRLEQRARIEQ